MLRVSLTNLVVPLELVVYFLLNVWSSLSESRLVIFHWDPKSNGETKRVHHLVINKCVKLVVKS